MLKKRFRFHTGHLYCFLFLIVQYSFEPAIAQHGNYFHIGIQNGLPSEHIYYLLEDRKGYLWMSTPKGVVKYNGYTFKEFGLKEGLVSDDVWSLFEDDRNRIWFSTFGDEIGYVRNDVFHIPHVNRVSRYLRPIWYHNTGAGIAFLSIVSAFVDDIYIESRDSIYLLPISYGKKLVATYSVSDQAIYAFREDGLYKISMGVFGVKNQLVNSNISFYSFPARQRQYLFEDCVVYETKPGHFLVYNFRNDSSKNIIIYEAGEEHTYVCYYRNSLREFFIVTDKHVFVFNKTLDIKRQYSRDGLLGRSAPSSQILINFLPGNFWGNCIATNSGVNMFLPQVQAINPAYNLIPVDTFEISKKSTHTPFLDDHVYLPVDKRLSLSLLSLQANKVFSVVPINTDSTLVFSDKGVYWFDSGKKPHLKNYFQRVSVMASEEFGKPLIFDSSQNEAMRGLIRKGVHVASELHYFLPGIGFMKMHVQGDTGISIKQHAKRYTNVVFDSTHKIFFLWGDKEIFLYKDDDQKEIIRKEALEKIGIKKIKQIVVDAEYGNIFILAQDRLLLYNIYRHQFRNQFSGFNLEEAQLSLFNKTLVVAGRFGVLCSRVVGSLDISKPVYYPNIKDAKYTVLNNLYIIPTAIYLNTDKGYYTAPLPNDNLYRQPQSFNPSYKFLIKYNDSFRTIHHYDTVDIEQNNLLLQFDAINPYGIGNLSFKYRISSLDKNWANLPNEQLYLPQLQAGKYYQLVIIASDAVWHSSPLNITIYIVPLWWQTISGKTFIWTGVLIIMVLLLLCVTTIVNRINKRKLTHRTLQLELQNLRLNTDLKSIYAQINPHFIFNTLSTTAYFIRKNKNKEARDHVLALSRLLRSYITSTRNRGITIKEEAEHLKNYISLQLARFENRFDYVIHIDKNIDIQKQIPPLLLQPLVENAINHGLIHADYKGVLKISFIQGLSNTEVFCTIEDNGIGRKASKRLSDENRTSPSFGSNLINELITAINSYNRWYIELKYEDKEHPQSGTLVKITIQYL